MQARAASHARFSSPLAYIYTHRDRYTQPRARACDRCNEMPAPRVCLRSSYVYIIMPAHYHLRTWARCGGSRLRQSRSPSKLPSLARAQARARLLYPRRNLHRIIASQPAGERNFAVCGARGGQEDGTDENPFVIAKSALKNYICGRDSPMGSRVFFLGQQCCLVNRPMSFL